MSATATPVPTQVPAPAEQCPDMRAAPEAFMKYWYQILKKGFEDMPKEKDAFNIKLVVPAPSDPEDEDNANDQYIEIVLAIINTYCEGIGFIDQSENIDIDGKPYAKLKITCSNWEGWTTYKQEEKEVKQ